ncbi:helix-turn-helix domain-containing protein [Pontibacter roseus]|uniref:helix-turn-helix domain-containing protein n=1 Tax=Pontibacter roseus TaxID=336989 RepID=UPI0003656215|nr:helix-turn-helix domain-containing protein [Pontibacter roseus]
MNNPFENISARLSNIESLLLDIKHINNQTPPKPDRCSFDEALEITGLSKSKLYKLTASKEVPHKRYGNRLIFSRKELANWVEEQTVEKSSNDSILALAASAKRKKKGGCHA